MKRPRILFVDDDRFIRLALEKVLQDQVESWDISYADSGEQAWALHLQQPFDVIVSDVSMEELSGIDLLHQVRQRTPQTLRFLLTSHTGSCTRAQMATCAHMVLAKPLDRMQILQRISDALWFADSIEDTALRETVLSSALLPRLASTTDRLASLQLGNACNELQYLQAVNRDVSWMTLAFQIIQMGSLRQTIRDSLDQCRVDESLDASLFLSPATAHLCDDNVLSAIGAKSVATADLAMRIAKKFYSTEKVAIDAWWAGMLHDVGKLVLISHNADYANYIASRCFENNSCWAVERSTFGASHAELGGLYLGLRGASRMIREAVMYHHEPCRADSIDNPILTAVHLASAAIGQRHFNRDWESLDFDYLGRVGIDREIALRLMGVRSMSIRPGRIANVKKSI